jgi:hypothetical protein
LVQRHQPPLASPYSIIKGHGARVTALLSTAAADFVSAEPTGDERVGVGFPSHFGNGGVSFCLPTEAELMVDWPLP